MSMMVSFVLSFFPRDVLDEILNLIESVSEDFPSYSCQTQFGSSPRRFGLYSQNVKVPYLLLYIKGTKIRNKIKCTP